MHLRASIFTLLAAGAFTAQGQQHTSGHIRQLDLNSFAAREAEVGKAPKKVRLKRETRHFRSADSTALKFRDSMYVLTRFPAPTNKTFALAAIESRIDHFDSSKLELCFVVLQLHNGDTVFKEFAVVPKAGKKQSGQWHSIAVRDAGIVLQPAPFYLGYIYRPKTGSNDYRYTSYNASAGGEGAWLHIRNGSWRLSRSQFYEILPFKIEYSEL